MILPFKHQCWTQAHRGRSNTTIAGFPTLPPPALSLSQTHTDTHTHTNHHGKTATLALLVPTKERDSCLLAPYVSAVYRPLNSHYSLLPLGPPAGSVIVMSPSDSPVSGHRRAGTDRCLHRGQ